MSRLEGFSRRDLFSGDCREREAMHLDVGDDAPGACREAVARGAEYVVGRFIKMNRNEYVAPQSVLIRVEN